MAYRIAAGLGQEAFPALLAKDAALSAETLRVALALFNHLANLSPAGATINDLMAAARLPEDATRQALETLQAAGYIAGGDRQAPAGEKTAATVSDVASSATDKRPTGRSGRLSAGIMDYQLDLDRLIRAGDANLRDAGPRERTAAASEDNAAGWDPLADESAQPAAMRFMVWLKFVLRPDELEACDRFALSHEDEWQDWIGRFKPAKAKGTESELLADIRNRLARAGDVSSILPARGRAAGPSRPN